MNLTQRQIQIQRQEPESLSDLVLELADLFLDYHLSKPDEIARIMGMLRKWDPFPEITGEVFLMNFIETIEEDAETRGYSLEVDHGKR
jgi:hypothetical protein